MSDDALFAGYEPPVTEPLSAGRRLTLRQHTDIERGVHPLTKEPLPNPSPGTCGDCAFRVSVNGDAKVYPKCFRPGVRRSCSVTTDVRAFWPACPGFVAAASLSEEQQTRLDCGENPAVVIR